MTEHELISICASSIYEHGQMSTEDAVSLAQEIISISSAEIRREKADARVPRPARRAAVSRPPVTPVSDEELPF
jgi:hypothetical protein